jgi:H+/Na+-translocating ferredoxin:NAD+ oxidoreductase subunit G
VSEPQGHVHGASSPTGPGPDVPASKLMSTLAVAGGLAGLLIVLVYGWASPIIAHNKALALQAAIGEVLKEPAECDTLYVMGNSLTATPPAGIDLKAVKRVYLGRDAQHRLIGFAIPAAEPGFQDVISLIFGYDPATKQLLGLKVLDSKETPGLGAKIESDTAFGNQFGRVTAPLKGVKSDRYQASDPHQVDMITGATISSRAVIRIISNALTQLGPLIETYQEKGKP